MNKFLIPFILLLAGCLSPSETEETSVEETAQALTWSGGGASTPTNALRCLGYSYSANPSPCNASGCTLHGTYVEGSVLSIFVPGGGVLGSNTDALISLSGAPHASVYWGGGFGLISFTFTWGAHGTCIITNQGGGQQTGTMVWN